MPAGVCCVEDAGVDVLPMGSRSAARLESSRLSRLRDFCLIEFVGVLVLTDPAMPAEEWFACKPMEAT